MFLKLLKYDFKYYTKNFMAIVVGVVCCTILSLLPNSFITEGGVAYIYDFKFIIMFLVIIFMVYSVIQGIRIFNRKFISEESYLSFSLPVTKNQQLLSNLIICIIWITIIFVVTLLFLMSFDGDYIDNIMHPVRYFDDFIVCYLQLFINAVTYGGTLIIMATSIVMLLNIIYFCIAFVNATAMKRFSKMFGIILFSAIIYIYNNVIDQVHLHSFRDYTRDIKYILVAVVFAAIFYLATHYILEKKIEVD